MRHALVAVACCGCVSTTIGYLRSNFESGSTLEVDCATYPNDPGQFSARLAERYAKGWRLASSGQRTTSFLGISSSEPVLCLERPADSGIKVRITLPSGDQADLGQPEDSR